MGDVTVILNAVLRGERQATDELIPAVYDELRQLAARQLDKEAGRQTLQATELVHEAYLRLIGTTDQTWEGRRHFFGAAAEAMRRILIERARQRHRPKHGGHLQKIDAFEVELPAPIPSDELLALGDALDQLQAVDRLATELVKLRFFAGLAHEDAARVMGVTRWTADQLWAFAKAWLYQAIHRDK